MKQATTRCDAGTTRQTRLAPPLNLRVEIVFDLDSAKIQIDRSLAMNLPPNVAKEAEGGQAQCDGQKGSTGQVKHDPYASGVADALKHSGSKPESHRHDGDQRPSRQSHEPPDPHRRNAHAMNDGKIPIPIAVLRDVQTYIRE